MSILGYSSSYFLGQNWGDTPLYQEKIIPMLDYFLSNNFVDSKKLSEAYDELINKYTNTADLPADNIREYIKENGYEYVLNLLNPNDTELKVVVYLLVLIHQLKGSKEGIKIVLSLFQSEFSPTDTVITEWFNTIPVGTENTFSIDTNVDIGKTGDEFFTNFKTFIQNYVYPELSALKVNYKLEADAVPEMYVQEVLNYTVTANMDV